MKLKFKLLLVLLILLSIATGYYYITTPTDYRDDKSAYVDFDKFKQGRPCSEIKFMCLPESQDKSWQSIPLKDGADSYELTSKRLKHYNYIVNAWQLDKKTREERGMLITDLDKDFHKKVEAKQFLIEMEENLEKEFPGFWKETPKQVRYRWIRRAMAKAKKLGYGDRQITDNIQIIELCARIGLDFDLDPKWKAITQFVTLPKGPLRGYAGAACEYLDFTVFEKDYIYGQRITDWSMRDTLNYLPQPQRPIPKLSDIK